MNIFENEGAKLLIKAILRLKNEEQCEAFLDDLLTVKELVDISQRIQVAHLLKEGKVYSKIAEETGASTATISRVNRCFAYGKGGYKSVLADEKAGQCKVKMVKKSQIQRKR